MLGQLDHCATSQVIELLPLFSTTHNALQGGNNGGPLLACYFSLPMEDPIYLKENLFSTALVVVAICAHTWRDLVQIGAKSVSNKNCFSFPKCN